MSTLSNLTPTIILIVSTMINHVFKEDKTLTMRDFMIMLSPTIATILPIIIGGIDSFINIFFDKDPTNRSKYFSSFMSFFKSEVPTQPLQTNQLQIIKSSKKIILTPNIAFMQMLIKYIVENKDTCSYNITNIKEIEMETNETIVEKEVWSSTYINHKNLKIYISPIEIEYVVINNEKILKKYRREVEGGTTKYANATRLTDFMPECELKQYLINKVTAESDKLKKKYDAMSNETNQIYFDVFLATTVAQHCPKLDKFLFLAEFHIMDYMRAHADSYINSVLYNYISATNRLKLFDFEVKLGSKPPSLRFTNNGIYTMCCSGSIDLQDGSHLYRCYELNSYIGTLCTPAATETKKESMEMIVSPIDETIDYNIDAELHDFISDVKSTTLPLTKGGKIKIYNTSIEKVVEQKVKSASAISKKERKELLSKFEKIESDQVENIIKLLDDKIDDTPQPTKKHVVTTQVNEKYKSLNTVYLREQDTKNLTNMLNKFKNNNELYETYGLPNKLGVLLYGDPGTGKSSTIQAIASYLNKNIYYVNLGTAESNADLQMIFDHINLQSLGGGIIVFEDIDAMTTLVHDRSSQSGIQHNMQSNSSENNLLTLEYLLNLLQGSLTVDGTIFIATTNHIEVLDPAFYRIGRFDVKIHMKKCDHYQIKNIYAKFVGKPISDTVLHKIKVDTYVPAEIIFHLVNYIGSDESDHTIMSQFIST